MEKKEQRKHILRENDWKIFKINGRQQTTDPRNSAKLNEINTKKKHLWTHEVKLLQNQGLRENLKGS